MSLTQRLLSASAALVFSAAGCLAQTPTSSGTSEAASTDVRGTSATEIDTPQRTVSASQIRIVRLSQVRGEVQLDRSTGQKFEAAFTNLPIVAGEQLRTGQGVAEVEFEDNSSLRLITGSQVDFPELGRSTSGSPITTVNLVRGSLYVSLVNSKAAGEFTIHVGRQTLTLAPSSHIRLDLTANTGTLAVFQGNVTASGDSGSLVVGKHKAITFDLAATAPPVFAHLDEPAPFDDWDKNAVDYHKIRAVASTYASSPYSYGVNDLAYYGSFSNVAGCGNIWRPYLATASFDPYSSGIWSWYPGAGYSWVSPYPWGWTPYHSGSWAYCGSGVGWGWQPQGNWNGLQNVPVATKKLIPGTLRPRPPLPPVKGQPTLVGVNLNRMQVSKPGSDGSFVFHGNSAGLGVPRGVFSNLNKISQHAVERGTVTRSLSETQVARTFAVTASSSVNSAQSGPGAAASSVRGSATANRTSSAGNSQAGSIRSSAAGVGSISSASSSSHAAGASPGKGPH